MGFFLLNFWRLFKKEKAIMSTSELQILKKELTKIFEDSDYDVLFKYITTQIPNNWDKITAICEINKSKFMLKVYNESNVDCSTDRPNGKSSPFVESEILRLLNKLHDETPCIPILIAIHKMNDAELKRNMKSIQKCIDSKDALCNIWNSINIGMTTGGPTFIAMECGQIDLLNYCKNATTHIDAWIALSFIWMILYTLKIIWQHYPDFHHGDLYARNIIICFDYEYIKTKNLTDNQYYLKFSDCYVPYNGMIPKMIDFELSILNDDVKSKQNIVGQTDDILQLLYSIKTIFKYKNFLTDSINKLIGLDLDNSLSYIQMHDIIHRHGGMPSLERLLNSPVFDYQKIKDVPDEKIWGDW